MTVFLECILTTMDLPQKISNLLPLTSFAFIIPRDNKDDHITHS